jgi:hypothetical protein
MSSLPRNNSKYEALAIDAKFTKDSLTVILADGREISMPLEWSDLLRKANKKERSKWRLIGGGIGLHWDLLDEDILVESLLRY